jgi:hypothetical protein
MKGVYAVRGLLRYQTHLPTQLEYHMQRVHILYVAVRERKIIFKLTALEHNSLVLRSIAFLLLNPLLDHGDCR